MARRIIIVGTILAVVLGVLIVIPYIQKARLAANMRASVNNLREMSLFAAQYAKPEPNRDTTKLLVEIPAATIVLPDTSPENRLSWAVALLPGLDQKRQDTRNLLSLIDTSKPWPAEANQKAAQEKLITLLCPENPPGMLPGEPAVTSYVGISGVGAEAATLPADAPKAGAFRYGGATPFPAVKDGISQSLLFGETRTEVGPWLRGGASTTRGLIGGEGAAPLLPDQFGGYFPDGGHFAFCDGHVQFFTVRTTPEVLLNLATIAGGEADAIPGE